MCEGFMRLVMSTGTMNTAPVKMTLIFVRNQQQILLGLKKRGFGSGKWNGFGGKVVAGETFTQAAVRELKEESGLLVTEEDIEKVAELDFEFVEAGIMPKLNIHVFEVWRYTNDPIETEEMRPEWYDVQSIPYDQMWVDDKVWLPLYLQKRKFKGSFLLRGMDEILKHTIEELDTF